MLKKNYSYCYNGKYCSLVLKRDFTYTYSILKDKRCHEEVTEINQQWADFPVVFEGSKPCIGLFGSQSPRSISTIGQLDLD